MKLKEKVLEILENNQGKMLSGQEIAQTLGVSRNSVWKCVNSLKADGYPIMAQSNVGYMLSSEADIFSANRIKSYLKNNVDIILIDEADSSNNVAKELAAQGAAEGTTVVVKRQMNGKGRMGRSFISNEENGLYMSIILRPMFPASESVDITVIGALAALEAIESTSGRECSIKWVNDIYIEEKKVCGILTEAALSFESGCLDYAVLGIGINVTPPKNGFSAEIKDIATSVYALNAPRNYKNRLCAAVIDRFLYYYKNIENKAYIKPYKDKSNIIGKHISVWRGNEVINGVATDIDDNANLIVETKLGKMSFNSGEARVRKDEK